MLAVSLFSGVGGFEQGLERAGIRTVLQAERDPWCQAVLARHWPEVRRVGDVSDVISARGEGSDPDSAGIDLIYGGFPCQDLSVAGKRAGLGGSRSGLWFEFRRVLSELRPRWALIENVPGLLSSNRGRDFGTLLSGLDELGFAVAWAVLDAQHFGVPQRRRRVFIVGGPDRRACEEILAVCESCGGHPPTRRAPGERAAYSLAAGAHGSGGFGRQPWNTNYVTRTNQTGANGLNVSEDLSPTQGSDSGGLAIAAFDERNVTSGANRTRVEFGFPANTLHAEGQSVIVAKTLEGHAPRNDHWTEDFILSPVGFMWQAGGDSAMAIREDGMGALQAPEGVRRLTPLECERLMGWPDDWTRWTADGREVPDSVRYRMCGNGVVSTVAEWTGWRLIAVDRALKQA